jgi:hypothetical protein
MIPSPSIDDLAGRIRERAHTGPYVLFLGEGCAVAAGAPSAADIARAALRTFGFEGATKTISDEEVAERFAKHAERLSRSQLTRMLRSLYASVPVPSFYQDLALMIRERYFPLVVTMNFDSLLEQALAAAGVRNADYRVTTFGVGRSPTEPDPVTSRAPLTHIVKLRGDLAQGTAHVTPDQIETALRGSRQWIKSDLKGDLIMVGHVLNEDPIDRWLAHSPVGELWWVSKEPPTDPARVAAWSKERHDIIGDLGRPQVFFLLLAVRLLRQPAERPSEAAPVESPDLSDILQREIVRNQSVLYTLEQDGPPGDRAPQLQAQIDYQKRQIVRLEDRMRALPDVRPRVLDVVKKIGDAVRRADGFAPLADYVQGQLATLEAECGKETPNQILVSASLGATLTLANRLLTEYGATVVDPEDVRQLAALAPTAAAKVIV